MSPDTDIQRRIVPTYTSSLTHDQRSPLALTGRGHALHKCNGEATQGRALSLPSPSRRVAASQLGKTLLPLSTPHVPMSNHSCATRARARLPHHPTSLTSTAWRLPTPHTHPHTLRRTRLSPSGRSRSNSSEACRPPQALAPATRLSHRPDQRARAKPRLRQPQAALQPRRPRA